MRTRTAVLMILIFLLSATQVMALTPTQKTLDGIAKKEVARLYRGEINIKKYSPTITTWSISGFADRYPEYFYIDSGEYIYKPRPNTTNMTVIRDYSSKRANNKWPVEKFKFNYTMTNTQIKQRAPQMNSKINQIVAKARRQNTNRKRIITVNNELRSFITYNNTTKNKENVYGAVVEKKANCVGYSKAFYLCMKRLGISCDYAYGAGKNGTFHRWNVVALNETRYKTVKQAYKTTITKKVNGKNKKVTVTKYKNVRKPYIVKVKYFVDVAWNDSAYRPNQYLLTRTHKGMAKIYGSPLK